MTNHGLVEYLYIGALFVVLGVAVYWFYRSMEGHPKHSSFECLLRSLTMLVVVMLLGMIGSVIFRT